MKKILIVDDQADVRELVEVTLDIGDYELFQASTGPQALDLCRQHVPDLVFLDVMMPEGGMDGFQVCEVIKNETELKHIVVIMLSAKGQEMDKKQGTEAGANDYFTKPFSPLALLNKVEEVLS
ncbi:MAG: response regulator [Candidatus Marinimicrobia bacterium]|jgi:DNA-binding response OmpR family regulator|nr:response regulator [Candidatus Neomarinimicrobiota bacterium]MBT3680124.1 response regulator [Candidatus Neomarinimicrobiota bacterium]MBT3949439.1 response regulator [Candidatus Neomarinimicrobiota bacterium]MBT4296666.1 response regulator [Candidatus Neomarinimicrobiota bacterium]MBT4480572.1 response regulator [Candidatus Neomarinimicrobiota bacterium]